MKTTNILQLYEHLYKASNEIKGETIDYNRGFQDAVYMLQLALKNFEHINLHIENIRLKRQLLLTDLNFDDSMFTISELRKQISEIEKYKPKKINTIYFLNSNICEMVIDDYNFIFQSAITQEELDKLLPEIGLHIQNRLMKKVRKNRPCHRNDYKAWTLEFLRGKGIDCRI